MSQYAAIDLAFCHSGIRVAELRPPERRCRNGPEPGRDEGRRDGLPAPTRRGAAAGGHRPSRNPQRSETAPASSRIATAWARWADPTPRFQHRREARRPCCSRDAEAFTLPAKASAALLRRRRKPPGALLLPAAADGSGVDALTGRPARAPERSCSSGSRRSRAHARGRSRGVARAHGRRTVSAPRCACAGARSSR